MHLLNATSKGIGPPVVFLHGMVGSSRYWDTVTHKLHNNRTIAIDLLGFGKSVRPKNINQYKLSNHIESILYTLDELNVSQPVILVGHSMGATIALSLAVRHPQRVKKLILIGLPLFESASAAYQAIITSKILPKWLLDGWSAKLVCHLVCNDKKLTRLVLPWWFRNFPKVVAQDTVSHNWYSYRGSLKYVLQDHRTADDLAKVKVPTIVLVGQADRFLNNYAKHIFANVKSSVSVQIHSGSHQLALEQPEKLVSLIEA